MDVELEPRYRNYWLDIARKEKKEKEENERKQAIAGLMGLIKP